VREVRRAVGPEIELKLDANQGWNLADAVKVINAVEDCDIRVVEQPLPEWDLAGAAALRQRVAPPIMLDEAVKSPADMVRIIQAGAADMVNIKLLKTGGIYPALAVNSIAESAGIVCQIGTLDTSIGSAAGAHLATAKENIQFIEINGPTRLKWDVASGLTIQQGRVKIGNGPGYGLEVDRSRLS
jgi:L-alanine-DL-glutamate epimerase-like enolase superfamily enzyme